MMPKWVSWLEELNGQDYPTVGKKCASLAEMAKIGLPVPAGFTLTVDACRYFFDSTGLKRRIGRILEQSRSALQGCRDYVSCREVSRQIRQAVEEEQLPPEVAEELIQAYEQLQKKMGKNNLPVAVRSSGPVSRPGLFETYLNVQGAKELVQKVVQCWSSIFTVQALAYRLNNGLPPDEEPIAVGVISMVKARSAGVAFTAEPVSGAGDRIVVEGNWGLGESVVAGRVSPDRFVVSKKDFALLSSNCTGKRSKIIAAGGGVVEVAVEGAEQESACLKPEELDRLARLSLEVEKHFGVFQDIEWAVSGEFPSPQNIFLLQTRPITGLTARKPDWETKPASNTATDHIIDLMLSRVFYRSS